MNLVLLRHRRRSFILAGLSALIGPTPASADNPPSIPASPTALGKIRISDDSKQLVIQGIGGESVSRVVSLSVTEGSAPVSNLRFVTTPLQSTDSARDAQSAPPVTWEPKEIHLRPGEPPIQVLVTFLLQEVHDGTHKAPTADPKATSNGGSKPLASGEFKSILHLIIPDPKESGETHVEAEIPMSVKVHHDWPWPLGVLAAGVAIGMFFSWFKSTGKDRDTALVGRDGLVEIVDDPSRPALLVDALCERRI